MMGSRNTAEIKEGGKRKNKGKMTRIRGEVTKICSSDENKNERLVWDTLRREKKRGRQASEERNREDSERRDGCAKRED